METASGQDTALRIAELESRNRELARRLAGVEADFKRRAGAAARGVPSALQILRRIKTRVLMRTLGRGLPQQAQWVLDTGLFDATAYKALAGLTGLSDLQAAAHYATVGEKTGLRPNAEFDPAIYAESYPELAGNEMGLLVHYTRYGRAEGRLPAFDPHLHVHDGGRTWDKAKPTMLVVCHEASRTGAPILGWNLVRAFADTYNVVAVLLRGGELVETFATDAAALAGPFRPNAVIPRAMARLAAELDKRFAIDIAIANSMECHPMLHGLADVGIPCVALVHEFPANIYPPGTMTAGLMMATQVVFDADVQRQAALDAWPGVTRRNQHVFHQGASEVPRDPKASKGDSAEAAAKRAALREIVKGADGARPVVLGLGTISMRKGVDLFVAVAQAVAARLGPNAVRFVWIGNEPKPHPDGNYCDWLADQVKRAGLGKTVTFLDPVDDLDGAYAAADVVLSPSRLDPFPNVAMDAALAGLPVVCFDRANGFAEFLTGDERTGSLAVPYLDVAAAAEQVLALLADAPLRRDIGGALQERARRDFAMARYVERLGPVIAEAKAIKAQEKRDVAFLAADDTFAAEVWLNPHESMSREAAIRFHVRKSASGQERAQYCRRPALGFVPQTYSDHHPELDAAPFENPLAHWVRAGRPAGPWSHPVTVPTASTPRAPAGAARTALHIHLHYPELAQGILDALAANATRPDLFVSTTSDDKVRDLERRFAGYRVAPVVAAACPNRGRDIGPMLTLFAERLQAYDVVGHFHGKRSLALTSVGLSTDLGVQWHEFLLQTLLGAKFPMVDIILGRFAADPKLGLVFPEDPNLTGWSLDRDLAITLAHRMDPAMSVPRSIDFPIGTMFWMRPAALKPLFDLKLGWDDYPEEPVPIDGTMLHALERLLPVICHHAGFTHETTHVPGVGR
ncbi:MAG TPA: rhamnan synthesis F family protein [Lichenihabitans sp.]|nr:rhamnan synthesis F family protein [Lichenihabitans sp.]